MGAGEVCAFIRDYTAKNGFPPTPRMVAFSSSLSALKDLETDGFIVIHREPAVGVMLTEAGARAADEYRLR